VSTETVFEGKLVTLVLEDGKEIVRHAPAVAIVPVDGQGRVVLVRQQRPAVGGRVLELPAGLLEPGEQPLRAAQRELQEETGLHGGEWVEAAEVLTSPGFTDERIHLFVARGLEEGDDAPDDGEELELVRVPAADVPGLLAELEDAKTLAGLLLLLRLES
jgi:ADP-ribose pyrophosphatase